MSEHVIPYKDSEEEKKKQVAEMFDNIAHKYDFLNHFLSLNIDKSWRKKSINLLQNRRPKKILDVATGTGDLALESYKRLDPDLIIGIDISKGMLEKAKDKISKAGLADQIQLEEGDSENIKFPDASFDAITVAFGVRNFENLQKGLKEMHRVLKTDGEVVILEFSRPEKFPVKQLYRFYFKHILPAIGKLFSKDMSAYSYLPESVDAFPYGERFAQLLNESGFRKVHIRKFTFGIAMVYHAKK